METIEAPPKCISPEVLIQAITALRAADSVLMKGGTPMQDESVAYSCLQAAVKLEAVVSQLLGPVKVAA